MELDYRAQYYVYLIISEEEHRFDIGITTNLQEYTNKKKLKNPEKEYLVYHECFEHLPDAVKRESELLDYSLRKLRQLV